MKGTPPSQHFVKFSLINTEVFEAGRWERPITTSSLLGQVLKTSYTTATHSDSQCSEYLLQLWWVQDVIKSTVFYNYYRIGL